MQEIDLKRLKKIRWMLRLLGWFRIPMIGYVRPRLLSIDSRTVKVEIPLRRRTRNHLGSMYFGALAVGADIAAGIHVFYFADTMGKKVSFAFKGMEAEFLKRAESNVVFSCEEGERIKSVIEQSLQSESRVNEKINVKAFSKDNELVAQFIMTISVKVIG